MATTFKTVMILLGSCCLISCWMYGVPKDVGLRNRIADEQGPEAYIEYVLSRTDASDIIHGILTIKNRALHRWDDPHVLMNGIKRIHDQLEQGWPGFRPHRIAVRLDDGSFIDGNDSTPTDLYPLFHERIYEILYLDLASAARHSFAPPVIRQTFFDLEPREGPAFRHAEWKHYGEKYSIFDSEENLQ